MACVAVVALGCSNHEFVCQTSDQCVDNEVQGTCELSSFCSFPDPSCSMQRRYGELAAPALAGQCVEAPNLVVNGTCDNDTSAWQPFQATVSLSTTARTGSHSCKICGAGMIDFTMDDIDPTVPTADPGDSFLGEAWVRTAPGEAPPSVVFLEIRDATTFFGEASNMPMVTDTWQPVTLTHEVRDTTQPVEVFLAGHTPAPATNPCFLVDDISLVRVK